MSSVVTADTIEIAGIPFEVFQRGTGKPLLVLHGAGGPRGDAPFMAGLEAFGRVIAPSHPGFGATPLPDWIRGVDDLAYLYLELLEQLDLHDVTLIGMSMGGWTACEIATKCRHRLAKLILVGPVGIKVSDRETRDIPDIYALSPTEVVQLTYHNPANAPDYERFSDDAMLEVARNREAAVLYLWEPYMHNPQLRRRLRLIDLPSIVLRGASDGLVSETYARAFAASIPNCAYEEIPEAGHSPQTENPSAFLAAVKRALG
jgi:pimeloyl-ACP methyl ester carboxylesterase